ncbi:DUF3108 domain-containing protein [Candidatus Kryptobacter tengchongensis]|uniref:DUF3108 domain-containing protein n=1 Tax=Kryptobacter tengchongensis TaxID=1643429 RepID=A0A656D8P6_KRYT1|nr:DUF3108 domain-containing protein [Candidatus Kryptobacter tengchongensis]CUT01596.1 Protein of unknown function (DUF3108) [Candidatus Kryptobacter tengchongensis]
MKRIFLILSMAIFVFYLVEGKISKNDFKFENEYLEYHAFWGFINLGSIKIWTKTDGEYVKSRFQMDSNPWLFFISIHYGFESEFKVDSLLDSKFLIYETKKGRKVVTIFERKDDKIIATQKDIKTGEVIEVLEKNTRSFYNGIAAFYLTRQLLGTGQEVTIPILIQLDVKDVKVTFPTENANIKFSNLNVKVKKVVGFIPFITEEIAGVTGDFIAYYSDDPAKIPIRAYFKTSLGNVKVELVKWDRKNWEPSWIADKNKN